MKRFLQIIWILAGPVLWISIISAVSGFLWMAAGELLGAWNLRAEEWILENGSLLITVTSAAIVCKTAAGKQILLQNTSSVTAASCVYLFAAGAAAGMIGSYMIGAIPFPQNLQDGYKAAEEHIFVGSLVLQAIGVCIAAPAAEEVIFRGMIFGRLKTILNVPISVFLSALIFALYHGNFLQGLYAGYLGILLAYAAEKKGGLKAPVLIHSGANTAAFLLTVFR